MTRKILAIVLALAMVFALCLTACGGEQAEEKETTKAAEKDTTKAEEKDTTAAGSDEKTFEFETVDWYNALDMSTKADWNDYVWPELQRYFLEQLNVQVEYHGFSYGDYTTKFQAAITSNTGIDLMGMASGNTGFFVWYERNALEPLDDLLADYAPDLVAEMPDYAFQALTINGTIYGMPTIKDLAIDIGFFYNETMLNDAGKYDDFFDVDFKNAQDFDGIFHEMLDARNELHPEWADDPLVQHYTSREAYIKADDIIDGLILAKINDIGCLDDYEDEGAIQLYSTPDYKDMIYLIKNWVDDGINAYDAKNLDHTDIRKAGELLGYWTYGDMTANRDQYAEYGWTVDLRHPTYSYTFTGYPQAAFTSINALTTDAKKVAAMRVYNLMSEDSYVVTTMHCGVEGIHWERMTDEAGRTRANFDFEGSRNSDPTAYNYKQWYFYTTGNLSKVFIPSDEGGDFVEIMNEINANALTSKYMGFVYATTNTENEIAACVNVKGEYNTDLLYGMIDDIDSRIDAFNQALEANGIQTIVDDANAQMAEWLG